MFLSMFAVNQNFRFTFLQSPNSGNFSRKVREGFSRNVENQRRSLISWRITAQAAKFAWKFATSKSVGDMIRFQSRQTIRSSVHTVRPAAVQIVDHLQKYSLANCAKHFQTAVKSLAAIGYTLVLNVVLVVATFLYTNLKALWAALLNAVYDSYLYLLGLGNHYFGALSDFMLVSYTTLYLLGLLLVSYLIFRTFYIVVSNIRAVMSVGRDLTEVLAEEIDYEEDMRRSNFVESVQQQLNKTILVGQVQTQIMPNGSVVISPLPKENSNPTETKSGKTTPPVAAIKNKKK